MWYALPCTNQRRTCCSCQLYRALSRSPFSEVSRNYSPRWDSTVYTGPDSSTCGPSNCAVYCRTTASCRCTMRIASFDTRVSSGRRAVGGDNWSLSRWIENRQGKESAKSYRVSQNSKSYYYWIILGKIKKIIVLLHYL